MKKKIDKKFIVISSLVIVVLVILVVFIVHEFNHINNLEKQISNLEENLESSKSSPTDDKNDNSKDTDKEENNTSKEENKTENKEDENQNNLDNNAVSKEDESNPSIDNYIVVPELTNKTLAEATKQLESLGFTVASKPIEISDDSFEKGLVIKTNPPSGSKRTKGTIVTIYVSTGDSKHEIEDYTGRNYLTVKGELEALGIIVMIEKRNTDNQTTNEKNIIIGQSIKAGTKLKSGDSITLYISNT